MNRSSKKLIVVLVMALFAISLFAQSETAKAATASVDFSQLLIAGEPFTEIIGTVAAIVLALFIVKFVKLFFKEKLDTASFYNRISKDINAGNYQDAVNKAQLFKQTTLGHIFWNGLLAFNEAKKAGKKGDELKQALQNAFEEASYQRLPKIEAMLDWFDIFGQAATLLGLLGTIWGLIVAFSGLSGQSGAAAQDTLTTGIYKAMGTTGMGLIVAIPTQVLKGLLQSRANKITDEIDEYSVKTINLINNSIKE